MTTTTNIPEGFNIDPKGDNCKISIGGEWVNAGDLFRRYSRLCGAATAALTFLETPPATERCKMLANEAAQRIRAAIHGGN